MNRLLEDQGDMLMNAVLTGAVTVVTTEAQLLAALHAPHMFICPPTQPEGDQ